MSLARQAFVDLFPNRDPDTYTFSVSYHDKFKPFNGNVTYTRNSMHFNLSKKWKGVSDDIAMGLIQELMLKIFKVKKSTLSIDLYNNFMRHVHIAAPKDKQCPHLSIVFDGINEQYFSGILEKTNLTWHDSVSRLGHYEYGSDTISISKVLKEHPKVLGYVMYHEMLHKDEKYEHKNGRACHHTPRFKAREALYEDAELMEKACTQIASRAARQRRKTKLFGFFR